MKSLALIVLLTTTSPSFAFDLCGDGQRINCVVDGDTVWIEGEKIRLKDIDAPENNGTCTKEREIAVSAAGLLAELLDQGGEFIVRSGKDKYGRTLAQIYIKGESVGDRLIAAGYAKPWKGHKASWCD